MIDHIQLKSKIDSGVLFKVSRMKPFIKTTQPHGHKNYFEIIFLTAGAGWHWIDTQRYSVQANALYFILPGQVHCWELTQIPEGFVLMFRIDFLLENHLNENELLQLSQWLNGATIEPAIAIEVVDLLQRIEQEYKQDTLPEKERIMAAYLNVILLKLKNIATNLNATSGLLELPFLHTFRDHLEQQFRSKRQVKYYADLLAISPKYLNDVCKKATGKTASEFIEQRVVLEAKKLLIHTTKNVAEIAFELDFQDPSHFAKFFSRCSGMSPKQYRERIR